jgi:asparagine synthase (glutamine-hydrolysing)
VVDYLDECAARFGIEPRLPFFDRSLAEFMLALPEKALTGLKERRGLHKMAMTGVLPPGVNERRQGVAFTSGHVHNAARAFPLFRETLLGGRWESGDYVAQDKARLLLDRVNPAAPDAREWLDWTALRDIVCLEIWMRGI